ncbi:hypothetical protein [Kitasatospora azatica]|uniref:hypothetical protein n=1 Tax=Kitasatospora azatica TaxID=58347 RepID=UPI00055ECBA9|nr:hypothetical protein [Kitasatospora azatica]
MLETDADPDAWAVLSDDLHPCEQVAAAWLLGLGFNRAAPAEVLVSLFDTGRTASSPQFLHRADLPTGVLDAAVVHPSKNVRGRAAESGRLSAEQWSRLLAATTEPHFRYALAELAADQAGYRGAGARIGVERPPDSESRPPASPAEIAAIPTAVMHRLIALTALD